VSRFGGPIFPARYTADATGLTRAEHDLERLVILHDAYSRQPDITPVWQGYIDQKAGDVTGQQAIVAELKAQLKLGHVHGGRRPAETAGA
jgi:hypothetical protein